MIQCLKCGKKLKKSDDECPECGAIIFVKYCRNCGEKLNKEDDVCPNCNTKVIRERIDIEEYKKGLYLDNIKESKTLAVLFLIFAIFMVLPVINLYLKSNLLQTLFQWVALILFVVYGYSLLKLKTTAKKTIVTSLMYVFVFVYYMIMMSV